MDPEDIVGTLETLGGIRATLTPEGWSCSDALFGKVLNQLYPYSSKPEDGEPGFRALTAAHQALGGSVHYFPSEVDDPNAVY